MTSPAARPVTAMPRGWLLAVGAVSLLYLLTRLLHLTRLPVFLDEAMHLDWAFRTAATGQLVGHTDGGRYLPIWAYAVVATGAADPLRSARLCSVVSGLATVLGLAWLGRLLDPPAAGLLAAFLYVAAPFTLLYDRMALVDSLLSALVVYAALFAVLWARSAAWGLATALALTVGAAGLTKLSGLLLLVVPAAIAAAARSGRRALLRRQLPGIYGVVLLLLLPIAFDRGGTGRFFVENLWMLRAGAGEPSFLGRNAQLGASWLVAYLTPIGAVLVALAAAWSLRGRERADLLLLLMAAGWCAFFVLVGGRYWFPRYMLPAVPLFLLLLARRATRAGRAPAWLVAGMLTVAWLPFDTALIADPVRAPLPPVERSQYIYDWPSGYGLGEVFGRLRREAERRPIVVLRDQSSTPLKEGLDLLLRRQAPPIETVDAPVKAGDITATVEELIADGRPVFLAVDEAADEQVVLTLDGRRAVAPWTEVKKPDGVREVAVYAVAEPAGESAGRPDEAGPGPEPVEDQPASAAVEARRGWTFARRSRWDDAADAFRRSLALKPTAAARNGLGLSLWQQGLRDEALRSLEEARRMDGEDLRAAFNLNVARSAIAHGR